MKKLTALLLIAMLLTASLLSMPSVFAEKSSDISVTINGEQLIFDQAPVLVNDRVLVPMRAIFEAFNAMVFYEPFFDSIRIDAATSKVILSMEGWWDDNVLQLAGVHYRTIDMYENHLHDYTHDYQLGEELTSDVNPILVNDRVLVPIRVISETLGAVVEWDGETQTVVINGEVHEQWKSSEEVAKMVNVDWNALYEDIKATMAAEGFEPIPTEFGIGIDFHGKYFIIDCTNTTNQNSGVTVYFYYDGTYRTIPWVVN